MCFKGSFLNVPCFTFFVYLQYYLSVCIVGPTLHDSQTWTGFCESRLRKLVSDGLSRSLPLKGLLQLWPQKVAACIVDPTTALVTPQQRQNAVTYFIGFAVDTIRMRGTDLNLDGVLNQFRDMDLSRFQPLIPGMDILCRVFAVKSLPAICFISKDDPDMDPLLAKRAAMKRRRAIRDADPERQRVAKLKALQEKVTALQQKKRKREESEEAEDGEAVAVKDEEAESQSAVDGVDESKAIEATVGAKTEDSEEADQLESALETVLETSVEKSQGDAEVVDDVEEDYTGDVRELRFMSSTRSRSDPKAKKSIRALPLNSSQAKLLEQIGYPVVSDDECKPLGSNMLPPWHDTATPGSEEHSRTIGRIKFRKPFDVVELDAMGQLIDRGDDDFSPSKQWTGRKAGFEFKLGARGLGYYRTGKPVVMPSSTSLR